MSGTRRACALLLTGLAATLLAGCADGRILANPVPTERPVERPAPTPSRPPDPQPIVLPADDGPHDRLTEWWYYTGHLASADGRRFGFEHVVFRAERGRFPVSWVSHLAITDETGGRFHWDERLEIGPQVDRSPADGGFDLAVSGLPGNALFATPWTMAGSGGVDRLSGIGTSKNEPGLRFGIELALDGSDRPAVLHDEEGYIDFGPAGGSYYLSRTRMAATGTVILGEERIPVTGSAWFDHQWGDFISVGGGGWDWFAVNLADGTDLKVSRVRAADGSYPLAYGTIVRPDGTYEHVPGEALVVETTASWTSPRTGATWPAGWRITVPAEELVIELQPTVADQELDTRATTGVVYWEGSQVVSATRAGIPLGGEAYVELTGYGPGLIGEP